MIIEMMKKYVTSYAEVWIEIAEAAQYAIDNVVTSYAEVWIEMEIHVCLFEDCQVTSYAEVWIEILIAANTWSQDASHLLRGGVD